MCASCSHKKVIFLSCPGHHRLFMNDFWLPAYRVFEYFPGMLHAKSLILDDWFMVGSSNLNHRSLLHDLEVDVNLRSRQSKQMLLEQFIEDLAHAKEIQLSNWYKRPWHQKLVGRLLLYIKYWI